MKIGILGAGHIGRTLARKLAAAGHDVTVANSRGPETIDAEALSTGARAVRMDEALRGVDVAILSIPLNKIPGVAALVADLPESTVVMDTSNYYPMRDERIDAIEKGQVESLWVSEQLGRPVVKAWNSIGSDSFARMGGASGTPERIALPVASDSDTDRKVGMALVKETGFDAYDAGALAESWRQQPGAPCYCTDLTLEQLPAALAAAERDRLPKRRDLSTTAIAERVGDGTTNPSAEYGVRLVRALFM
jgi:8-hydroxy-5-deazaflavin:NADPH oxidoreductase